MSRAGPCRALLIRAVPWRGVPCPGRDVPCHGRAVPAFIGQALRGDDVPIFGDGSQTRSFQYVSDLVEGVVRLMASDEPTPVNLGNPKEEHSVKTLAETIIRLTGSSSKLITGPLPPDDPKIRRPDMAKATRVLDWEPSITLEIGLEHTIRYFPGGGRD